MVVWMSSNFICMWQGHLVRCWHHHDTQWVQRSHYAVYPLTRICLTSLCWELQERSRIIGGVSDGLLQGTEALARGFAYGFRGVVTKPVYSARQNGFAGFFSGLGKAAVGVVVQPVSGALDFVALTVNGVGTSCTNCFDIFERKPKFGPARLPQAICGDGILRPYDEQTAYGQVGSFSLW